MNDIRTFSIIRYGGSTYMKLPPDFVRANKLKRPDHLRGTLKGFEVIKRTIVETEPEPALVGAE